MLGSSTRPNSSIMPALSQDGLNSRFAREGSTARRTTLWPSIHLSRDVLIGQEFRSQLSGVRSLAAFLLFTTSIAIKCFALRCYSQYLLFPAKLWNVGYTAPEFCLSLSESSHLGRAILVRLHSFCHFSTAAPIPCSRLRLASCSSQPMMCSGVRSSTVIPKSAAI